MPYSKDDITGLLDGWSRGDPEALERLVPLVIDDLRRIARKQFARENAGHTLQPTALVNEVYLRLVERKKVQWANRVQFFAFAAELMRRALVDHARKHRAAKRGGGAFKVPVEEAMAVAEERDPDLLALDEALGALAVLDPRQARIVELRVFGGLSNDEIAEVLELSRTTIKREWRTAKLWLFHELKPP